MLNYDKPSLIFPYILLTRNHMIFLVQFGINKHLLIFSKTTNWTRPTGSCNFVSLFKNLLVLIYSKLHTKSCDYLYETTRLTYMVTGFYWDVLIGYHLNTTSFHRTLTRSTTGLRRIFMQRIMCLSSILVIRYDDKIFLKNSILYSCFQFWCPKFSHVYCGSGLWKMYWLWRSYCSLL